MKHPKPASPGELKPLGAALASRGAVWWPCRWPSAPRFCSASPRSSGPRIGFSRVFQGLEGFQQVLRLKGASRSFLGFCWRVCSDFEGRFGARGFEISEELRAGEPGVVEAGFGSGVCCSIYFGGGRQGC